jgi:hypothetical protein
MYCGKRRSPESQHQPHWSIFGAAVRTNQAKSNAAAT